MDALTQEQFRFTRIRNAAERLKDFVEDDDAKVKRNPQSKDSYSAPREISAFEEDDGQFGS